MAGNYRGVTLRFAHMLVGNGLVRKRKTRVQAGKDDADCIFKVV
jgi:hypothetical protein